MVSKSDKNPHGVELIGINPGESSKMLLGIPKLVDKIWKNHRELEKKK